MLTCITQHCMKKVSPRRERREVSRRTAGDLHLAFRGNTHTVASQYRITMPNHELEQERRGAFNRACYSSATCSSCSGFVQLCIAVHVPGVSSTYVVLQESHGCGLQAGWQEPFKEWLRTRGFLSKTCTKTATDGGSTK
eukprot:3736765-Amphidinium_carterae.1